MSGRGTIGEQSRQLVFTVGPEQAGRRLDQVLAGLLPEHSRSRIQQWIREGHVQVAGERRRQRDPVHEGERVEVALPRRPPDTEWAAQARPLDILYEDEAVLVLNKPAGRVVHPGAGNADGTLLNALLHHDPALRALPRAGIVHRLDKDTTGLMVVAKTEAARLNLVEQLDRRELGREYLAVVVGVLVAGGTVDAPIGRHPRDRLRQAVIARGRPALTHYRVERRYRAHSLLRVNLETGRTHQIRVHMAHIHHPVVGDPVYGGRLRISKGCSEELAATLRHFKRQALHARRLAFRHPASGEPQQWEAPPPRDLVDLMEALDQDLRLHETAG